MFVMFMVLIASSMILVAAEFGMSSLRQEVRYEDFRLASTTWDAAVAQLDAQEEAGTLTLPYSGNFTLNNTSGTITAVNNNANLANSILLSGTLTTPDQRTYPMTSLISTGIPPTPFYYALFVNNAFSSSVYQFVTGSGGSDGNVFANGALAVSGSAGSTVNGSILSTGTLTVSGTTVTGTQMSSAPAITFTAPPSTGYFVDQTTSSSSSTLNGYTFGSVSSGSPYQVLYESASSVSVSGGFSGTGTVYFNGNVSVTGNLSYANASSHVAFIVNGNLTTSGQTLVGYWYVNGTTTTSGALTNTDGGLITGGYNPGGNTNLVLDPTVMNSTTTGNLLHLPGYTWTTTDNFVGTFSGTYTAETGGGTIQFTVTSAGVVSGSIDDRIGGHGTLSGTLVNSGAFNGTIVVSAGTFTVTGTLSLAGLTLSGSLTATNPDYGSISLNGTLTET